MSELDDGVKDRIEKEFNTHMLENGFASLFDFIRLKEFLKSFLLN